MDMGFLKSKDDEKAMKNINIPKIEDLFKNQEREYILYENKVLENRLSKAISSIETNMTKIKALLETEKLVINSPIPLRK